MTKPADLLSAYEQLEALLIRERTALVTRNLDDLIILVEEKRAHIEEMAQLQTALSDYLNNQPVPPWANFGTPPDQATHDNNDLALLPAVSQPTISRDQNPSDQQESINSERDPVHTQIHKQAAKCQELNLVNGRLVQRSRQSAAELMRIMQGTHGATTYGADGSTETNTNSSALVLA